MIDKKTIQKFDVPGPRYTSYPTAPEWKDHLTDELYGEKLRQFGATDKSLSIYIHIPFCRTLCNFCACNVVIRKADEKYGNEYLEHLFWEIERVAGYIGKKARVRQFHLGGGTPTFLTEGQLERLYCKIQKHFDLDPDGEIAIEIDPRTIDHSKVKKLRSLGFNRVSMGVQDFDEDVQKDINRIQPFDMVKQFYDWCRELKFHSVNFDLIYGLPNQTPNSFHDTITQVIGLKPDRIALYSFAHVPWLKKHQRKIDPGKLPEGDNKLDLFLQAREQFLNAGYQAIAMDHFATADDELAQAYREKRLYRNFMGYTVKPADEYIGFGLTSIGFLEKTFIQNVKALPEYYAMIKEGKLPLERGKILSTDDQIRQWTISALMCHFQVDKQRFNNFFGQPFDDYFSEEANHIKKSVANGLLEDSAEILKVTPLGEIFIRNVCMGFDFYLRQSGAHKRFSKTV